MSVGTSEDLAGLRLGDSQDVFQLFEVIEFGLFLPRRAALFFALNQFDDPLLRLGRGSKRDNRLWSCTSRDEVDDLEISRANCTHMALIITLGDAFQEEMQRRASQVFDGFEVHIFYRSARVFCESTLEFPYRLSLTPHEIVREEVDER
jgi:hypothetical protein